MQRSHYYYYYGARGEAILSVVQDVDFRVFSTVTDLLHRSNGHASFDRKRMAQDPSIMDFTTETCRDREWDNIACVHRAQGLVN